MPGNSRRRGHSRTNQVRAPAAPLTTLKVAVTRGGTTLTDGELIAIHRNTHTAPGFAPLKASLTEDRGQPLFLSHTTYLRRTRHHHRPYSRSNMLPLNIL